MRFLFVCCVVVLDANQKKRGSQKPWQIDLSALHLEAQHRDMALSKVLPIIHAESRTEYRSLVQNGHFSFVVLVELLE